MLDLDKITKITQKSYFRQKLYIGVYSPQVLYKRWNLKLIIMYIGIDCGQKNTAIVAIDENGELVDSHLCSVTESIWFLKSFIQKHNTDIIGFCIEQPIPYRNVPCQVSVSVAYAYGEVMGYLVAIYVTLWNKQPPCLVSKTQKQISSGLKAIGKKEAEIRNSIGIKYWNHNIEEYNKLSVHERDAIACALFLKLACEDQIFTEKIYI